MSKTNFRDRELYFRVTYPDPGRRYPQIESFVFVGKNMSDEDEGDRWYFQNSSDFGRYGAIPSSSHDGLRAAVVGAQDLVDFLDLNGLIDELQSAAKRRM